MSTLIAVRSSERQGLPFDHLSTLCVRSISCADLMSPRLGLKSKCVLATTRRAASAGFFAMRDGPRPGEDRSIPSSAKVGIASGFVSSSPMLHVFMGMCSDVPASESLVTSSDGLADVSGEESAAEGSTSTTTSRATLSLFLQSRISRQE